MRKPVRGSAKPIAQYDETGRYIRAYPSAAEAGRKLGLGRDCAAHSARCHTMTTSGYMFRYI